MRSVSGRSPAADVQNARVCVGVCAGRTGAGRRRAQCCPPPRPGSDTRSCPRTTLEKSDDMSIATASRVSLCGY